MNLLNIVVQVENEATQIMQPTWLMVVLGIWLFFSLINGLIIGGDRDLKWWIKLLMIISGPVYWLYIAYRVFRSRY